MAQLASEKLSALKDFAKVKVEGQKEIDLDVEASLKQRVDSSVALMVAEEASAK